MTVPPSTITAYHDYLVSQNRPTSSVREHIRYANRLAQFVGERKLCEHVLVQYRAYIDEHYTTYNSKNSCISYANALLRFLGKKELALPYFKASRVGLSVKTPALTDEDIEKLLNYAEYFEQGCDTH